MNLTPTELQSYLAKIVQVATLVHTFVPNVGHGAIISFLTALENDQPFLSTAAYVINSVVPAIEGQVSPNILAEIKAALSKFATTQGS